MAKILILGGGFGGLTAAEKLSAANGGEHQITLVSHSAEFTFYPALTHVAFGNLQPADIKFDLRAKLEDLEVRFVQGEILRIDAARQTVEVYGDDFTGDVHYDFLIIAIGRRLATEKVNGFFEFAHHFLGAKSALKFRQAVEEFEQGKIIVGLCPQAQLPVPVCETALALARKFAAEIAGNKISVQVVFPETLEKAFGGAKLAEKIEAEFEKTGVQVVNHFCVKRIAADEIFHDANSLNYDLLMLVPPFKGHTIIKNLDAAADEEKFARVNDLMQIEGFENIYAVGDIAALDGSRFASTAIRQAETAAQNILSQTNGAQPSQRFQTNIAEFIDENGADSIYIHYGIWDDSLYRNPKASLPNWAQFIHERFWKLP